MPKNVEIVLFADHRLKEDLSAYSIKIKFIKKSIFSRLYAEISLAILAKSNDLTLMLGGLPPIFKNASNSYLFIQNINNISPTSLQGYSSYQILRIKFERFWLRFFYGNVKKIIVQTNFVKNILVENNLFKKDILILPFFDISNFESILQNPKIDYNLHRNPFVFIFPASYEPHKNHINLIKAWEILGSKEITPTLYLTLKDSDFNHLMSKITFSKSLHIINIGVLKRDLLLDLYLKSDCMIYPSKYESFGLPLVEATKLNLPIIASELQYVREVCCPVETFDPSSPISLADSVMRFMGIKTSKLRLFNPDDFLNYLLDDF